MPYQGLRNGLYLLKQKSIEKGVEHYGILDIGNLLQLKEARQALQPVVVHQTMPSIRYDWLQDTGSWTIEGKIFDEEYALSRIREAFKNPDYDLFINNCEHFARYVATGVRESRQVQAGVILTSLAALAIYALTRD